MMDLGFDQEQLAAALERVVFESDDVEQAINLACLEGATEVGVFPAQGQAQFQIHTILRHENGEYFLHVVAFDNDRKPQDPEYSPVFALTLTTKDDSTRTSSPDDLGVVIPLKDDPHLLIGARLALVV